MEPTIQHLLQQVSLLTKKYDDIAKISGENFNIFKLLKLETNEVRTHSAILGELLNPNGSHGLTDVFLKLFVSQFNIEDFETKNAFILIEEHIGNISDDSMKGGRIDLVIKQQNGKEIIIENKIYASDQKNQLVRYRNHYPNAHIFYLTLKGESASEFSGNGLVENNSISYEYDILEWLDISKKETVNHPTLRETITQYINLIKLLTGQNTNKAMSNEIINILLSSYSNFKSSQIIGSTYHEAKGVINQLFRKEMERQNAFEVQNIFWKNISIDYGIHEDNAGLFFGFKITGKGIIDDNELNNLRNFFREISGDFKSSISYIGWIFPKNIRRFYELNTETLFNLYDKEFRIRFVEDLINEGKNYFDALEKRFEKINIVSESN